MSMKYDYEPGHGKPNPITESAFDAMSGPDRSKFMLLGGTLISDPIDETAPKERETITSASGLTITIDQWDAMSAKQQAEFICR